jgi:hypothetical protein
MEPKEIKFREKAKPRKLKYKALVEVLEDATTGEIVLVMSKGIKRKWLLLNLPEGIWQARCTRGEAWDIVRAFLTEKILTD